MMAGRKPRGLRPGEAELWGKAIAQTTRLRPEQLDAAPRNQILSQPKAPIVTVPRFRVGEAIKPSAPRHNLAPSVADHIANQPVTMDRKRFGKLKKGRLAPEARVDLHGLTLAQAHPRLIHFILDAASEGRRLVLVITGKGKSKPDHGPIPERHGALRHQVPHWLHSQPLKPHILQITEAHLKHGGQGAYYVYLRKPR